MPRISRSNIHASFLHVITQGIDKSYIFNNHEDIKFYIKLMYKLKEEYQINIIAYCIMNNHTHMLIESKDIAKLSMYMHRLNSKYGHYYNKKHQRVGYVFRDRFKSEEIKDINHFYNCIKYIYDNPVKAGITKTAKEYPFSNYKEYAYKSNSICSFIDTEEDLNNNYKFYINHFLKSNHIQLEDFKKNKKLLIDLILNLKSIYGISNKKISELTNISKEKIRTLYKQNISKLS